MYLQICYPRGGSAPQNGERLLIHEETRGLFEAEVVNNGVSERLISQGNVFGLDVVYRRIPEASYALYSGQIVYQREQGRWMTLEEVLYAARS